MKQRRGGFYNYIKPSPAQCRRGKLSHNKKCGGRNALCIFIRMNFLPHQMPMMCCISRLTAAMHTVADLQANIEKSKAELSALERERSNISNRIRRPKSPEEQAQNKECRKAVSKQMKPVRERLHRAERILEKSPHLYELLKQEHELEKKARARYKERGR